MPSDESVSCIFLNMATAAHRSHDDPHGGGGIETDLLEALRSELGEERARKESLERRGLAVAAAATTSLALLLGLGSNYAGVGRSAFFVVLSLGSLCFLISAYFGWRTSQALKYSEIALVEFQQILQNGWTEGSPEDFRLFLADGVLDTIVDARKKNSSKADLFDRSLIFLLGGAALVLIAIGFVFVDRVIF
jgi:hypothetical protein